MYQKAWCWERFKEYGLKRNKTKDRTLRWTMDLKDSTLKVTWDYPDVDFYSQLAWGIMWLQEDWMVLRSQIMPVVWVVASLCFVCVLVCLLLSIQSDLYLTDPFLLMSKSQKCLRLVWTFPLQLTVIENFLRISFKHQLMSFWTTTLLKSGHLDGDSKKGKLLSFLMT